MTNPAPKMQYYVVQRSGLSDLVMAVNKFIGEGWEPMGGVCYSPYYAGSSEYFYQAIVKK
jgi:hypothetical protein